MPVEEQLQKIDIRVYIGILFFRWQIIVACFLYCMLGGLLFVQFATPEFNTYCSLMIYTETNMKAVNNGPWSNFSMHRYLLEGVKLRKRVVDSLAEEWAGTMGGVENMLLPAKISSDRRFASTIKVTVKSSNKAYGNAFLSELMKEHESEWRSIQRMASDRAAELLDEELVRLDESIRVAEDNVIEYQRLHDIPRVAARATVESQYLASLISRRSMLTTELMLLEAQTPALKGANAEVIFDINALTRETGALEPEREVTSPTNDSNNDVINVPPVKMKSLNASYDAGLAVFQDGTGYRNLRIKLIELQKKEKKLSTNLKAEHPQLVAVRKDIADVRHKLEVSAEIAFGQLKDRRSALLTHLKALESAEYRWQAKNLMAIQRQGELKRLVAIVARFEKNYSDIYSRLHEMRVSHELKTPHFRLVEQITTDAEPAWPDPQKILMLALVLGLGSGFGLALLVQILDNKIQSIDDVEKILKVPFLGGIPCWVYGGLEKTVRPIVTEEHSTGAVEAYRSLRTAVVASLDKMNEKLVFVTSADAKEGKTLTTLNLVIMLTRLDKKVLLVDMDLRRGRIHRSLGLQKEPGFNDVMRDKLDLADVIVHSRIENLDVIPSGTTIDNCAELLQDTDLRRLFVEVEDHYDYIFVDTAPVLRVTDTVIIATQGVGVVLYIARVNKSPLPLIQYSLSMLSDARILGLVMNSIEMHKISSLYYTYQYPNYAYYSNAYAYGYDYYYYGDHNSKKGGRGGRRPPFLSTDRFAQWFRRTFLPMD